MAVQFKRLLNTKEALTEARLKATCEHRGARVFAKVRLADTFAIDGSGLDSEAYGFALRSHFDFTVCDAALIPLFAVEFDSILHDTEEQRRCDALKAHIVDQFEFPLLRVRYQHMDRRFEAGRVMSNPSAVWLRSAPIELVPEEFRELAKAARETTEPLSWDLLSWFVENWFYYFDVAQAFQEREIDEETYANAMGMGMTYVLSDPRWPSLIYPFNIASPPLLELKLRHDRGQIRSLFPETAEGWDEQGNYRAFLFVAIDEQSGVWAEKAVKSQRFRLPDVDEVTRALGAQELLQKLDDALADASRCTPLAEIRRLTDDFRAKWLVT